MAPKTYSLPVMLTMQILFKLSIFQGPSNPNMYFSFKKSEIVENLFPMQVYRYILLLGSDISGNSSKVVNVINTWDECRIV